SRIAREVEKIDHCFTRAYHFIVKLVLREKLTKFLGSVRCDGDKNYLVPVPVFRCKLIQSRHLFHAARTTDKPKIQHNNLAFQVGRVYVRTVYRMGRKRRDVPSLLRNL